MKVYVVYGYGYGEVFCDKAFSEYEMALGYIADEFTGFIQEGIEDETISGAKGAMELLRVILWVGEKARNHSEGEPTRFIYTDPDDKSEGIYYYIAELEIK